jgi:hypothetical protein
MNIDFTKVSSSEEIEGDDEKESQELLGLFERAKRFISKFSWCKKIDESYFGFGLDAIVGVFLFKIEPRLIGVDEWLWVIVGDLPSAYIVTHASPDPASAVSAYVTEMRRWIDAVKAGKSVSQLIPVNAPPTNEFAQMLETRLSWLEEEFIPLCKEQGNL